MNPDVTVAVKCNCLVKFGIIEQLKPCEWEIDGGIWKKVKICSNMLHIIC